LQTLKKILKGYEFKSQTDSEVIGYLLEENLKKSSNTEKALSKTLKKLRGTYGIAALNRDEPGKIFFARMGSPLVIGIGKKENYIASDPTPIVRHTKKVIFLNDGEMGVIDKKTYSITNLKNLPIRREPSQIDWQKEEVEKSGFKHFMMKEMMEGSKVLKDTLRGRLLRSEGTAKLGGLVDVAEKLKKIDRITKQCI